MSSALASLISHFTASHPLLSLFRARFIFSICAAVASFALTLHTSTGIPADNKTSIQTCRQRRQARRTYLLRFRQAVARPFDLDEPCLTLFELPYTTFSLVMQSGLQ